MPAQSIHPGQQKAFKEAAARLGFNTEDFRWTTDYTANKDLSTTYFLVIRRGEAARRYPLQSRWLPAALADLYAGAFGAPREAETWNMPVKIPSGLLEGQWLVDAYFKLPDQEPVNYDGAERLFDSESEAKKAGRDWLRRKLMPDL